MDNIHVPRTEIYETGINTPVEPDELELLGSYGKYMPTWIYALGYNCAAVYFGVGWGAPDKTYMAGLGIYSRPLFKLLIEESIPPRWLENHPTATIENIKGDFRHDNVRDLFMRHVAAAILTKSKHGIKLVNES